MYMLYVLIEKQEYDNPNESITEARAAVDEKLDSLESVRFARKFEEVLVWTPPV